MLSKASSSSSSSPPPQNSAARTTSKARSKSSSFASPSSFKPKSVSLHKWWLVKFKNGGLAVSGFALGESKGGARIFSSAAIAKRHHDNILETTDGVMVTLNDLIDRPHSLENGFSPEVCNRFLWGFPYNWEKYENFEDTSEEGVGPESSCCSGGEAINSFKEERMTVSLDDLSATRIRDIILSPNHALRNRILEGCLRKLSELCPGSVVHPSVNNENVSQERTPCSKVKAKDKQIFQDNGVLDERCNSTDTGISRDMLTPTRGVATRQPANKLKNSPVNSSIKRKNNDQSSSSRAMKSNQRQIMTRSQSRFPSSGVVTSTPRMTRIKRRCSSSEAVTSAPRMTRSQTRLMQLSKTRS